MDPKNSPVRLTILALALALGLPICVLAQHYVPGTEGIRAGSTPAPGFYLEDYNLYSWADNVQYPLSTIPFSPQNHAQVYQNEPRLMWISGWKILGANFGMDVIVPFKWVRTTYSDLEVLTPGGSAVIPTAETHSGLGDVDVEPVLLSWHAKRYDISAGYGFWAPTGQYSINHNVNVGEGFWSQMFSLGGTWYPDEGKSWSVSILNHYEINEPNYNSTIPDRIVLLSGPSRGSQGIVVGVPGAPHYSVGDTYTLEWGVSKVLCPHLEIGGIGYYQKQVTKNSGADQPGPLETVALGPEIRSSWPKWGFSASLRYDCEVYTQNQAPFKVLALTLSKGF